MSEHKHSDHQHNENQPENIQQDAIDNHPAADKPGQTPLQAVKAQQAAMQQNKEVQELRPDAVTEVPGTGIPSNRRKHPQRQMG